MAQIYHTEQRFSIFPTYIVSTPIFSGIDRARSSRQLESEKNLQDNSNKGVLSKKAVTRLRNSVNWLVNSAGYKKVWCKREQKHFYFKINFITLTIPQQPDKDITPTLLQECLHNWLVYARKYLHLRNYVWKIEKGDKGKLHIHITADAFIHYKQVRESWNQIIMKKGLSCSYFNKTGHYNPNSTDVHSVRKVKDVAAYLCKYMSKETGLDKGFDKRIWGCSMLLSAKNKCTCIVDSMEAGEVGRCLMSREIRWKNLESPPDRMGSTKKVGEIFFINTDTWSRLIRGKLKEHYDNHRSYIRKNISVPEKGFFEIDYFSERTITTFTKLHETNEKATNIPSIQITANNNKRSKGVKAQSYSLFEI